jgi:hypothetical protein
LLSDLGSAVTGETIQVDAGYHILGMMSLREGGHSSQNGDNNNSDRIRNQRRPDPNGPREEPEYHRGDALCPGGYGI